MRLLAAVLSGLALASVLPARTPGFGEYRAAQESLRYLPPNMRFYELDRRGLLPTSPAPSVPDSIGLRLVGKWGAGPSVKVTGRDSLVFLSRGSQVVVINYADTANPRVLSYIEVNGLVSRSVLVGDRLYVGSTGADPKYIDVFDVSDPASPQRLCSLQTRLLDIDVVDTLVYTVAKDSFRVFDFSDPANPRQIGGCRDTGYTLSVCNGYAYIADRWGLYVVDVRDPTNPHHEGAWGTDLLSVKARGAICCVTTSDIESRLAFHVLDIRQPSSITQLGSIDSCGGYDTYIDGPLVFLSGFDTDGHVFRILDISDSTHPRSVGSCSTTHTHFGVWADLAASRAYVADNLEGLSVVDIANLAAPRLDTTMLKAGISYDLSVQDSLCYVASDGAGLIVLDASSLAQIRQIGILDSTRDMVARSIAVQDSFAYMSWGPARPWLRSISIADPTKPVKAGGVGTFDFPSAMVIRDSLLYVAQAYRFQVVNVARPRQPVLVGSCVLSGYSGDIAMVDTIAYLSGPVLFVVSVAKPDSPKLVTTWSRGIGGLDIVDTVLYAVGQNAQFWSLSVANPMNPRPLDSLHLPGYDGQDVKVVGTTAFVGERMIRFVDVADPSDLSLYGAVSVPGWVDRLAYERPYVFAACSDAGVCIFETTAAGIGEVRLKPLLSADVLLASSPVRDNASVRIRNAARKEVMGSAYNVAGTLVPVAVSVSGEYGWSVLRFDLRSVASGVYSLRIRVGETVRSLRVVKL